MAAKENLGGVEGWRWLEGVVGGGRGGEGVEGWTGGWRWGGSQKWRDGVKLILDLSSAFILPM